MKAFLRRRLDGSFVPACEVSEKLAKRITVNELIEVDWCSRNTRSVQWNKRYRAMLQLIHANSEQFKSDDAVHMWLKLKTQFYDAVIELPNGEKAYMVRSVAFDVMTAEEWAQWWVKAVDIVMQEILPGIGRREVEHEIEKVAGLAA